MKQTSETMLTNSMKQSPREANSHQTIQEIPCLLWNPKAHYCVHYNATTADEIFENASEFECMGKTITQ
jgi:beta-lactamase class D